MGYIVSGSGEIFLPAEDMNAAYQALMELNKHDELKRGGVWSEGVQTESHFSWMPADLSTLPTVHAIFTALGFTTVIDEDGLWVHEYESNKTGQEGLFFAAIAEGATGCAPPSWCDGCEILPTCQSCKKILPPFL